MASNKSAQNGKPFLSHREQEECLNDNVLFEHFLQFLPSKRTMVESKLCLANKNNYKYPIIMITTYKFTVPWSLNKILNPSLPTDMVNPQGPSSCSR